MGQRDGRKCWASGPRVTKVFMGEGSGQLCPALHRPSKTRTLMCQHGRHWLSGKGTFCGVMEEQVQLHWIEMGAERFVIQGAWLPKENGLDRERAGWFFIALTVYMFRGIAPWREQS